MKITSPSDLQPVHTTPEEFKNAALFLRLGLPSTLIRHENAALFLQLGPPFTLIRHENAALFLWLGLPSTLIRHKNTVSSTVNLNLKPKP